MSEQIARAALARLNNREVSIASTYQDGFAADLRQLAASVPDKEEADSKMRMTELCSAYGFQPSQAEKPFAFSNGIAIIPVHGSLINRFGRSWGYVTGYNFIRQQVALAGQDPDVKAIVFDMNSYGGEVAGCFETAADMKLLANGKKTLAVIDSNCYSACYALATAADKIVATPSGGAGSIGVVSMHVDMSKFLAEVGVQITFIKAGDHKVDGNPYEPLSKEAKADMQGRVDTIYGEFVALVATNRKIDEKVVRDTQARIYRAEEAKSLGLIDAIASPSAAVQAFFGELSGSTFQPDDGDEMSTNQPKPEATTPATAEELNKAKGEAAQAERARIQGIQGCEEAKGRTNLANHLAMNTDMSVDGAKAILAAAPKETPAAETPSKTPFENAMDTSANPNLTNGGGGDKGEESADSKAAAGILASARKAGVHLLEAQKS